MADLFWTMAMVVLALCVAAGGILIVVAGALAIRREFWNVDGSPREKKDRSY